MAQKKANHLDPDKPQVDAPATTSQSHPTELNQQADEIVKKNKRTPGLWIYDALLYPILNNTMVFVLSVGATYLTSKGGTRNHKGELVYGGIGEFFQKRGDWLVKQFKGFGMNQESANMAKMVFFSFADGTLVAPFVKVLEDHRETFAEKIDNVLGTKAKDPSVYEAEPKQSWGSVIGGRLATAAIVVPTAVAFDKLHLQDSKTKTFHPLNEQFFTKPGIALGEKAQAKGWFKGFSQKHDMPEIAKVTVFEAFYTTVCTVGLYLTSRFFARKQGNKPPVKEAPVIEASKQADHTDTAAPAAQELKPDTSKSESPFTRVESVSHKDTLASAPAVALSA